ncbi:Calcium-binding and coiled-coil domain-containing protein 1 [Liparis tanakae]|uniref:Calcium-binding and coiled-coil domain-containing protein 1 n=1 Tax=Liparis tanakae TaxID=230148 RepID=A0A4Z2IWZ4_9TELE|nr:Calcium-binding and coiled-coil domain-containing protein 1 [Liparis tanakae]
MRKTTAADAEPRMTCSATTATSLGVVVYRGLLQRKCIDVVNNSSHNSALEVQNSPSFFCVAMEKAWRVEFRNMGSSYFPQSRVDCHYTLSSEHSWASNDWIGLFKVGWSSVKDYHTFVWALAPADYQEGTDVNCCVHFQASYLPKSSSQNYEFVYIDAKGEVFSRSSNFTFCAPKPFEDLVTLEEEPHGEEGATDMLMVVPRAELLQGRLQECLRERAELLQAQEASNRQKEKDQEEDKRAREAWDRRRRGLESDIVRLQRELKHSREKMEEMEMQQKTEGELRSLSKEFQFLRNSLAQRDTSVLQLQNSITTLTQKLTTAHRKEAENEATLKEMRSLRERLSLNERAADGLKSDLSAMVAQRDHGQTDLHQARLQAAQLTLQLADSSLAMREGRARWAQERQNLQRTAEKDHERLEKLSTEMQRMEERLQEERMERVKLEVELGREKDCNRVQLSETRRELQELKSSLRVGQKEKEQFLAEKQVRNILCLVREESLNESMLIDNLCKNRNKTLFWDGIFVC